MKVNNKRLSVHHIGGRAGSRAVPFLNKFEKDIINVLYDADIDCIPQIEEIYQDRQSEIHVLPYCLGDDCKATQFNINYEPSTSSIKEKNSDYDSYYFFNEDHDSLFSEVTMPMEKRRVEMKTIDHIFQSNITSIPPPDFLSLDVQGAAYEVLHGAKETLKTRVLALLIEVEFYPFYKGQILFGDVVKLLSNIGFDFVRFLSIGEMSPFRAPISCRGEGFQMYADALFLRRIKDIENIDSDELRYYTMLQKLAFIAIVFNQFEFGLQCLLRTRDLSIQRLNTEVSEEPTYCKFLRELEGQIRKVPQVFPETFASKCTFEASKLRYKTSDKRGIYERCRFNVIKSLRKFPTLFQFLKQIRQAHVSMPPMLWFRRRSAVERHLIKYGLKRQAKILMKNRIIQSKYSQKV